VQDFALWEAVRVDLMWAVVAVTIATFTVLLAVRRFVMFVSELVFSRYVAVGGLVAFSLDVDDSADGQGSRNYTMRFEVGGPAVFHNVAVQLFGVLDGADIEPPASRHTMAAGDRPVEWRFALSGDAAARGWVMVTWVRPYLQSVESEALARPLQTDLLYEWRWYSETTRYIRTVARYVARRWPIPGRESLRELPLYGRWRRTSSNTSADLLGPAATPPHLG
jgi:hypothetical protein